MHKQKGISVLGAMFLIVIIGFGTLIILQMVPAYYKYFSVSNAIRGLKTSSVDNMSTDDTLNAITLRKKLMNQMEIDGISDIKQDDISIVPVNHGRFKVTVKYQVIRPLTSVIKLLFDFENTDEVEIGKN